MRDSKIRASQDKSSTAKKHKEARTPEAREAQMVSLAIDLAEKQLREGTASAQVITHYLKLGSSKEKIEQEKTKKEVELLNAKTKYIQDSENADEAYKKVLEAIMSYQGKTVESEDD